MKKLFLFSLFVAVASLTQLQAQCSKSAANASSASASSCCAAKTAMAASKAAAQDEAIEERVCAQTGKVSYVRKDVCPHSGTVSYTEVAYDAAKASFVAVTPETEPAKDYAMQTASPGPDQEAKKDCSKADKPGEKDKKADKASATASEKPKSANVKLVKNQ